MDNYSNKSEQDRELFKRAISEALDLKMQEIDEEIKNVELPPLSKDYKARMNSLFRESTGGSHLPFPEEDQL